ncbi:hypothetical protein SCP_1400410 [Sparassis crispa]|uniref:Uncharacterized protein n=1 Tax=Sparassis crispa TaxID=139825 RepID=A0A401H2F8_9APHY|nr:hypothetical protein SCP_1400410 [Sparassis crispa]GBE88636.1 hypothetical protein SCP_1400410 [Sparassis crispa]
MASSDFVTFGRYCIPNDLWNVMEREYQTTNGEISTDEADFTRLVELKKGVIAVAGEALKYDDEIEQWLITSNAKSGRFVIGLKRHNKGFKSVADIKDFVDDKFKAGGSTPLIETLGEALGAYLQKVEKKPDAKALTLVFLLDGLDDSMTGARITRNKVDLSPIKNLVMSTVVRIMKQMGCTDVRQKIGVQFCLITSNEEIIQAYNGFDNAGVYEDPKTGEKFECDIFDCTTLRQILEDMGGWDSPLTKMKLIGGPRNETLDNILEYLKEFALGYKVGSSANPPSYDDYERDLEEKRARA